MIGPCIFVRTLGDEAENQFKPTDSSMALCYVHCLIGTGFRIMGPRGLRNRLGGGLAAKAAVISVHLGRCKTASVVLATRGQELSVPGADLG